MKKFGTLLLVLAILPSVYSGGKDGKDGKDKKEKDKPKIQGTWNLVSTSVDGKKAPGDKISGTQVVITESTFTVRSAKGKKDQEHSIKLDPSKMPKHIDMTDKRTSSRKDAKGEESKVEKSTTVLGIYEVTEDELKICFGAPILRKNPEGKFEEAPGERPTSYEEKEGRICMVLRRAK